MRFLAGRNGAVVAVDGFEYDPVAVDVMPTVFAPDRDEETLCGDVESSDLSMRKWPRAGG